MSSAAPVVLTTRMFSLSDEEKPKSRVPGDDVPPSQPMAVS